LLACAAHETPSAEALQEVEDLLANADLPFSLQLRALILLDRPASGRSLVRAIAERIPNRSARRRFLAEWSSGARI